MSLAGNRESFPGEIRSPAYFTNSTSPDITNGNDLGSLNGVQVWVFPCMSVATTR